MGRILIGNIKGPQGEAGKNFEYAKTYASVSAMNADFSGTDVAEGEYVVISAGIDDADNGRVYRKGTSSYVYVNRVNGPTGPRGATGPMPTLVTNLDTTTAGQGALDASVGPTIKGKVTKEGGETGDTVTTFNTSDTTTDAEIIEYTAMEKLTSGSPLKTLMSIMSKAVKNVRWFQKLLGTTDISGIGNGTVTNAVSTLNNAITSQTNYIKRVTISGAPVGADGSLYIHVPLDFRYALVVLRGVSSNGTAIYMSACCMTNYSNANEIQVLHKVSEISNAVMTHGSTTGHPVILLTLADKYKSTTIDLGISVVACALK